MHSGMVKIALCEYTLILSQPAHTSLYSPAPALAHQVLSRGHAGLYSEGASYNIMIEALDSSENSLFFNNKL